MFIAINARADIEGSKKGKLTPAQNAQVNAWTLAKKTGIFNTLGKCTAEAKSPIGNVVSVEFSSGYFVVCGRLVEVEQGTVVNITLPTSGSVVGNIVARFTLSAVQDEEFKVIATNEPIVTEDLNADTSGQYDFVLYGYTAHAPNSGNKVELHARDNSIYIDDVGNTLANLIKGLEDGTNTVKKAKDYDDKDGTIKTKFAAIETRLTEMGFKEGRLSPAIEGATVTKMGKYAILRLPELRFSGTSVFNQSYHMEFNRYKPITSAETLEIKLASNNSGDYIKFKEGSSYFELRVQKQVGANIVSAVSIGFKIQ